jgi:hypothetical protein
LSGVNAGLDADEELPGLIALAQLLDGPGGRQRRVVLRQPHQEVFGQGRPRGAACDMARLPPEHGSDEAPGVLEGRLVGVGLDVGAGLGALHLGLALGDKAEFAQRVAADQAGRLEHVQPFEVGIAQGFRRHGSTGRRPEIDHADRL